MVSAAVMFLSILALLFVLRLCKLGWVIILLLAFAALIALSAVRSVSNILIIIEYFLFCRVPDARSRPFMLARSQPLLSNQSRATYLSTQSFGGRLILASCLCLASLLASGTRQMICPEIQIILTGYVCLGLLCLVQLALIASADHRQRL